MDTNTDADRGEIQKEINQLNSEIDRIGNTTEFNTQKLLDGGATANTTALGSNEATGTAARGAVLQSVNPDAVAGTTDSISLTKGELALKINGATFLHLDIDNDAYNAAAVGKATGTAEGLQEALLSLKADATRCRIKKYCKCEM